MISTIPKKIKDFLAKIGYIISKFTNLFTFLKTYSNGKYSNFKYVTSIWSSCHISAIKVMEMNLKRRTHTNHVSNCQFLLFVSLVPRHDDEKHMCLILWQKQKFLHFMQMWDRWYWHYTYFIVLLKEIEFLLCFDFFLVFFFSQTRLNGLDIEQASKKKIRQQLLSFLRIYSLYTHTLFVLQKMKEKKRSTHWNSA